MSTNENCRLPSKQTLEHATKIAIVDDKPIMMDYWKLSSRKKDYHWGSRRWRKVVG